MRHRLAIVAGTAAAALTLTACGPSAEDANHQAAAFYANHGGVKQIEYFQPDLLWSAYVRATCHDGSKLE